MLTECFSQGLAHSRSVYVIVIINFMGSCGSALVPRHICSNTILDVSVEVLFC